MMLERNYIFGINRKVVNTFHKLMLIAILHSSIVAPSQNIIIDYVNYKKPSKYYGARMLQGSNIIEEQLIHDNFNQNFATKSIKEVKNDYFDLNKSFEIISDINFGKVGISNLNPLDDAADNLFKFNISHLPQDNFKVYLTYELYGIDCNGVSKSINDRPNIGGYIVKKQNNWTQKKEEIKLDWLKNGENKIFFSIPSDANYEYQIRNVKLEFEKIKTLNVKNSVVLDSNEKLFIKDGSIYVKGFIGQKSNNIKVYCEEFILNSYDDEFEGIIKLNDEIKKRGFITIKVIDSNGLLGQEVVKLNELEESDFLYNIEKTLEKKSSLFEPFFKNSIEIEGVKLIVNDSSLFERKEIQVSKLRKIDIAPLSSGMVNVTKGGYAYRFLPDGTKFNKSVNIEIEYDEKLIPKGYSFQDIKTFYFDTNSKKWIVIQRDSIDHIQKKVISKTNHFTDYINGIIQTPDSPETAGFTSTMMNDVKAVDPSSEMTLISPPSVSQKGTANISYPIKIPAGRNGVQPNIALQYNSDAGNGWLGQGWNISIPAISLDTKWGAPKFDQINESEIYLLEGEQLMYPKQGGNDWMPNRHYDVSGGGSSTYSTQSISRTSNLIFTKRKQGGFERVERLGNSTTNYYWKVTTSDGTVYWYGGKNSVVDNSVIKDVNGNIVHWSLYLVEDIHTNSIKYEYEKLILSGQSGVNSNLNQGLIYNIKNIYYTGTGLTNGNYRIEFVNESSITRPDILISANLGVKQILPKRLSQIKVYYNSLIVRSYLLEYNIGNFEKTLLKYVSEKNASNQVFYKHEFNYYDDLEEQENQILFQDPVRIDVPDFNANYTLNFGNTIGASRINSSESTEFNWQVNLVPVGFQFFGANSNVRDFFTFGLPFGESYTRNKGKIVMVDMDGNGLDDVMYRRDNSLVYYPHYIDANNDHYFDSNYKTIVNINNFNKVEGKTKTMFLESFDIYKKKYHFGRKRFKTKQDNTIYLTDGNGDMLIDIVNNNNVYFNTGLNQNNQNIFETSSVNTENLVITADPLLVDPSIEDEEEEYENMDKYDVVRVWQAPRDGHIKISDNVTFNQQNSNSSAVYSIESIVPNFNNGIPYRLYLRKFDSNFLTESFVLNNYAGNNPPLGSGYVTEDGIIVKKGQMFFFRLHKNEQGENEQLITCPNIEYISNTGSGIVNNLDQNGLDKNKFAYCNDFFLSKYDEISIPNTGSVSISWNPFSLNLPSDKVNYKIIKVETTYNSSSPPTVTETVLYNQDCNIGSNTTISSTPINFNVNSFSDDINIVVKFLVTSDSNVKWLNDNWKPFIEYLPDSNATSQGTNSFSKYPIPKYSIFQEQDQRDFVLESQAGWNITNSTISYKVLPNIDYVTTSNPFALTNDVNGTFNFIVKKDGEVVGKRKVNIIGGVISLDDSTPITFFTGNAVTNPNQIISCDFYVTGNENFKTFQKYRKAISYNTSTSTEDFYGTVVIGDENEWNLYSPSNYSHFLRIKGNLSHNINEHLGSMYRNWGQFLYNDELDPDNSMPSDSYSKLINKTIVESTYYNSVSSALNGLGIDAASCTSMYDNENDLNNCLNAEINGALGLPGDGSVIDDNTDLDALVDSIYNNINMGAFQQFPCMVELFASRTYDTQQDIFIEKWVGFSDNKFSDKKSMLDGDFQDSILAGLFTNTNDEDSALLIPDQDTGMIALAKVHKSVAVSKGAGIGNYNFTKSNSSYSNSVSDFIDVNGDRYPDLLTENNAQLSNMTGGHNSNGNVYNLGVFNSSENSNKSISYAGSYPIAGRVEAGEEDNDTGTPSYSAGIGLNANLSGNDKGKTTFFDINGDGLVDRITFDNTLGFRYQLNDGKSFSTNYENFSLYNSTETRPNTLGVNFSLSVGGNALSNLPFSVSVGFSKNGGNTDVSLQDMNGDGLSDLLIFDGNQASVRYNLGNRFSSSQMPLNYSLSELSLQENIASYNASVSGSINYLHGWPICCPFPLVGFIPILYYKVGGGVSGSANLSVSETNREFRDFNNDGYADYIKKGSDGVDLFVYYSKIGRTNKLKDVKNPLGGSFTIDYENQKVDYNNPTSKWTLKELTINDGYDKVNDGVDVFKKKFKYENGKYDRREREFYGYETVKVEDYNFDSLGNEVLYRTNINKYYNNSYFLNGLVRESFIVKGNNLNQVYSKNKNEYKLYSLNSFNDEIDFASNLSLSFDVGATEGRKSAIVLLDKSFNEIYELNPTPQIVSEVNFEYDTKGRIKKYVNKGNVSDPSDDYSSEITYHSSMNALNIINIPKSIKVSTPSLGVVRERTTDVNSANGNIIKISANNSGSWAETNMDYDAYGNLKSIIYPQNSNGESMTYDYKYDSVCNKYVVLISDAFGYSSSATYDYRWDKPTEIIDKTGNKIIYNYDSFGRGTTIISPKEIASGKPYTIKFEYFPYLSNLPSGSGVNATNFVPVAVTSHYDEENPTNDIQTFTFVDGLAKPLQVKKDIYYNTGTTESPNFIEALSISGKVENDGLGRTVSQYHPWWEPKVNSTKFLLNENNSQYKSTAFYDELDRPIKQVDPEGNESLFEYTIDQDTNGVLALKTKTEVDQDGSQQIIAETFKDVFGRVISTNNIGPNGNIWTLYNYNPIGELLSYTDDENLTTTYSYDMFGRKLEVVHPDNGKTTFKYDNVNLNAVQTANLEPLDLWITYNYEINRISDIIYPDLPTGQNIANVKYKYGSTGNETGRLIYQEDATGTQEMTYGNMGELISNTRVVVGPNIPTREFVTNFSYDSWNRIQTMQYPDGEKIDYKYDLGGNLTQMTGELNGDPYDYIKRIDYDYFEQKTYLLFGNETETFYSYSPALRRLGNLNVKTSDGHDLFNNEYLYDKVGNVTGLINSAGITSNDMAGTYAHSYKYDNLNRLIFAQGEFDGSINQLSIGNDANSSYVLDMKYSNTHGILNKTQEHIKNGTTFMPNTYTNEYNYISGTHKLGEIVNTSTSEVESFEYDLNGNIIRRTDNNSQKDLFWDESNRLRVFTDQSTMQHYIYDASGERVLKADSDIETVYENGTLVDPPGTVSINGYTTYPNAFIVVNADGVFSKHYYNGTQRIVSRLGDDDASIFEIGCTTCKDNEGSSSFDDKALQQIQKQDVNYFVDKVKNGKVIFKDYQPISIEEQEREIIEESEQREMPRAPLTPIYYYHPDHLGTSTSLTDFNGNAYQFFLNLPFGETMAEQLGTNYYNTPFKFNGKELDEETGFYYYGARYYDPRASIWISVDPLTEKYSSWNPYNYTMQNPINLIDPDGREPFDHWKIDKNGNAQLIDRLGDGIFVMKEGQSNYTKLNEFDFTNNAKAFNQIISDYGKQAGYNGEFLTFSFVNRKLDFNQSYNINSKTFNAFRNYKVVPLSALPEAFPLEQFGICSYLTNGKVSDKAVYETKFTLINAIVHEKRHMKDNFIMYGANDELNAIIDQTKHSSWNKIEGTKFKSDVLNYAQDNYNILKNGWSKSTDGQAWLKHYKKYFKFNN